MSEPSEGATLELERIRRENALSYPGRRLDEDGRCCGKKPLVYKRPSFHYFCDRCNRQYGSDGRQEENWAYKGSILRGFVMSETSQKAAANVSARRLGLLAPYGAGDPMRSGDPIRQ